MEFRRLRFFARMAALSSFLFASVLFGCEGCTSCADEEPTEDTGVDETDVGTEEDTRAEDLEEAREEAEETADDLGFDLYQKARLTASEIEGRQADVDDPAPAKPAAAPKKDTGKIDVEATQSVFERNRGALQKCYERALKQDSTLQGKVTLAIRIGTDGSPISVRANSGAITDQSALGCMEREVKSWTFPRPKGGTVTLNKPFRFSPDQ